MSIATTACVLLCLACIRTIISSLVDEHETIIRALSGFLAGVAVHFTATPTLPESYYGKRRLGRHRLDDPRITTVFTLLSLYALFDILIARHVIWGIFPYLGWTTSFALQSSPQDEVEYYNKHAQLHGRTSVDKQTRRNDRTVITSRRHRSKNTEAMHKGSSSSNVLLTEPTHRHREIAAKEAKKTPENLAVIASRTDNANSFHQDDSSRRIGKVYSSEATSLRYGGRSRAGSSHVTFMDTASIPPPSVVIHGNLAKSSDEAKEVSYSGTTKSPSLPGNNITSVDAATLEVCLPLTRDNLRRITTLHLNDETIYSDEKLTFHTAESTSYDSEADSENTPVWMTVQSGESSSLTARNSWTEEVLHPPYEPSIVGDIDEDLSVVEESSPNNDVDNAVVLFTLQAAARNQIRDQTELGPDLIPQDYVSQTYVRVDKFVSAVDGIELVEQIEVIPGELQENEYDQSDLELRRQRRYLRSLLAYEPSETSSSTTVRLSELEGNIRAIDQRAEEHRNKSLTAKRKASALGERRKLALHHRHSDEAFRIKCAMRDYAKEAKREDKKAAKLLFRARNRPGTSRIDVHLLRKEEALKAVEKALREVQLKGGHQLRVIVGQGMHSANGRAVLKPFLKSQLEAQAMWVYESNNNPGMLIINMT